MNKIIIFCVCAVVLTAVGVPSAGTPPSHPSKITYERLRWTLPLGSPFRTTLANGLRVYVASDSQFPLVQISACIRCGTLSDPPGKEGRCALLAKLIRAGGTEKYHADTLDALLDLYAMKFGFSASEDCLQFSASFLADYTDTAFAVLEQMFFHPRFDATKLEKEQKIIIEKIRHQFDNPGPTLDIAYQKAMYSRTPAAGCATEQSVKRITRDDLLGLHRRTFTTGNCIFAIAGEFDRAVIVRRLEKLFPAAASPSDTGFPAIAAAPALKCLIVHKPISQVYVRFGLPLFKRPNADYYAVSIANLVLGGGGFTSRLGTRVRSDAGLTYSIYSSAESNYTFPGTWYVEFFTKSESFPHAMALALQIVDSLRVNGITDGELSNAKATLINEMPSMFRSPFDIVSTYAWNEYYGRSPSHYKEYPDSIKSVSREAVRQMFNKYFDPSAFTYTIVADTASLIKYKSNEGFSIEALKPRKTIIPDSIVVLP